MHNRQLRKSLYVKISVAFLSILTALGVFQMYLSARGWVSYTEENQQRIFLTIADSISKSLEPYTQDEFNIVAIEKTLEQFTKPPQLFDIYLVRASGEIAFHTQDFLRRVKPAIDVEPIRRLLTNKKVASGAILGENPEQGKIGTVPKDTMSVFSAAPITLLDEPAYVYVVFTGKHYSSVMGVLGRSYFLQMSIVGVVVSILAAAIIGIWSFSIITKPLHSLSSTVVEFSKGNYEARAEVDTSDELKELAETMNEMAEIIQEQFKELSDKDEHRRELVANISHDLRTPLTALGGTIETELENFENHSREEIRNSLEEALNNFYSMKNLVSELFELSMLEARTIKLDLKPIPVDELIEGVVSGLQAIARDKQQTLSWDLPEQLPLAMGDLSMILKVVTNLTQNALRYTPEGGEIKVCAEACSKYVHIKISDTGMGIPEEEQEHIFTRFYRVSSNSKEGDGGTGLGLAIVKQILDLHESEITLESIVDRGSTFYFKLNRAEKDI